VKVALLTPRYWPEVRRGAERLAHDLATGLARAGQDPRILTSHRGTLRATIEDGVPVVRVPRPPEGRLERRRYEHHLAHVPFSYLALARGEDDVAQALYPTDALAAVRWSQRTGRPAILSYLGIPHRRALVARRKRVEILRRAIAGSAAVTALSAAAAEAFDTWLGVKARVIPPGVDLGRFPPGAERAGEPTILCVAAAHDPRKRVDLLLEAFALVRRERPSARLVLSRPAPGGPGVEVRDLDDDAALARAYGEAWVSALPSHGEAFGLALLEGLACGTPGVGADDGGIPELLDRPETGRLFPVDGGAPALARALLEALDLAQDAGTRAACRARAEELSLEHCVEAHLALYRELGA
jgi:glycosyltransferase involved in cell wall biosynthesis